MIRCSSIIVPLKTLFKKLLVNIFKHGLEGLEISKTE